MLLFRRRHWESVLVISRHGERSEWGLRSFPGHLLMARSPEFRRGHVTKLRANINTTAGRLILFLFWVLFVWVLLFQFLYSNYFENLFANAALVFPIEFFVLKVIVGVVIALSILNPLGLFSVNVPAWTALLMSDRLTHQLHVFGPGRHIKLPWEVTINSPVRLELTDQLMDMHLLTRDSVAVIYRVNIGYMPQLSLLPVYLRATAQEITDKIGAGVHNLLETEVLGKIEYGIV